MHTESVTKMIKVLTHLKIQNVHKYCVVLLSLGTCGMDFSSSVRFQFSFEKNRGFGLVLKNRQLGFHCRRVVKYKKKCKLSFLCVHFGRRFSKCSIGLKRMFLKFNLNRIVFA